MDTNNTLIIDLLTKQSPNFESNGLLDGKMGQCIFLYHASRKTKNKNYEKLADDLMDQILGNIYLVNQILGNICLIDQEQFANGIYGIGWGIEYLVQNRFVEGDTDFILEYIDNELFIEITQDKINTLGLESGLIGCLYYIIWRLRNKGVDESMNTQINRELLLLIINKIEEFVIPKFSIIIKEATFNLFWDFALLFHALYEAFKLNIINTKICRMITQWITNISIYIPLMNINRIYLATTLTLIQTIIPDKRLEKYIQVLLLSIDFDILKTEVDKKPLNIKCGWTGFVWVLEKACKIIPNDYPNHSLLKVFAKEIRDENSELLMNSIYQINSKNPNGILADGIAGIGLLEFIFTTDNN